MREVDPSTVDEPMVHGLDWPMPKERPPMSTRERWLHAAPAIGISMLAHVAFAWWLLDEVEPWQHIRPEQPPAPAIEVFYFDQTPPPPPPTDAPMEVLHVYAVPFPMSAPTRVESAVPVREPTPASAAESPAPELSSDKLFGDIGGVASDLSGNKPGPGPRSNTQLPGRDQPFSAADFALQPPPPSPQKRAQRVIRTLMSTRGANNVTDFMGATEGRDPGREIQRGHHTDLYLPRGCDDPENPNTSDECMGIPKR